MTVNPGTRWAAVFLCCIAVSCAVDHPPRGAQPPPRPAAPVARKTAVPPPPRAAEPDLKKLMVIHKNGVGDVHLGKPFPKRVLIPAHRTEIRYFARMYADAQTFEGFVLKKPPVTASIEFGPFHHWFEGPWRKLSARPNARFVIPKAILAKKAVKLVRGGHPVKVIMITSPEPKTRRGIGVGSTLKAIQRAYGQVRVMANPPGFGHDRCVVKLPGLPVHVYFASCADAKNDEPVTRILMWE